MPKFVHKLIAKLQKHSAKPREGYFVLFFAIVVTMLMLPVLSGLLSTTVETRSQVANYYRAETARNDGESVLFTQLETLSRKGLGYFETDTVFLDELEEGSAPPDDEERERVTYTFSAASVITTPSEYSPSDLNVPTDADCYQWLEYTDDERLRLVPCEAGSELAAGDYHYYTVPALGTGDVGGADCQLGQLPTDLPGVDPLDHPCSWNDLSIGENVAIPLYVNIPDEGEEDIYEVFVPEALTLRLRFKCSTPGQTYCTSEERLFITHDDVDRTLGEEGLIEFPNSTVDTTPRVIDWAITGDEIVLPDQRGDFATESGRRETNREITVQRFYQDSPNLNFQYFDLNSLLGSFNINFKHSEFNQLLISDAFDRDAAPSTFPSFYPPGRGLLTSPEALSGASNAYAVTENAPILNLGFLNAYFEGCLNVETKDGCKQITEIEYQLISDVPMGNHKFVTTGISENINSTYALMKAEKRGPEVTTIPGTVFGS